MRSPLNKMIVLAAPKARGIVLAAGIGWIAAVAGCKKEAPKQAAPPPPQVTVSHPVEKEILEWDLYSGRLQAVEEVAIRARVSGYLQSVHFTDGAEVQKGDLLFTIDPRPYEAALDMAKAQITMAETRLELAVNDADRAGRLLKTKAISEEEADTKSKAKREAEASLAAAKSSMSAVQLNVDFARIKAPISGRIGRKMITEGNLVNGDQGQSTMLTSIVSMDPIYCYFDVQEGAALKYQRLLSEGKIQAAGTNQLPAELALENDDQYSFKGYVDFVENHVDPATGTLRMRAVFKNPGPNRPLQPGFFGRVRIPGTARYPGILVTDAAVGTDQSQKFVLTLSKSNTAAYTPVSLGPVIDGLRVVRKGLSKEDLVLVSGLMSARPGSVVKAEEKPMPVPGAVPANPAAGGAK